MSSTTSSAAYATTTSSDPNPVPTSVVTIGLGFIAGAFLVVTSAFFARISLARRRARIRGEPVPTFLDVFFSGGLNQRGRGGGPTGWGGMADVGYWGGGWGRPPSWAAGGRILNERMRGGAGGGDATDWSKAEPPKLWEVVLPEGERPPGVKEWEPVSVSRPTRSTPPASRRNSQTFRDVSSELDGAANVPLRATVLVAMPTSPAIRRAGMPDDEEDLPEVCFGVTTIHAVLEPTPRADVKRPVASPAGSIAGASTEKAKAEVAHVEHVEHADGTAIATENRAGGANDKAERKGKWRI